MAEDHDVWMTMIHLADIMTGAVGDPGSKFATPSILSVEAASIKLSQDMDRISSLATASGAHTLAYTTLPGEDQWQANIRAWCWDRCLSYMLWPYVDDAGQYGVWDEFEIKGSGMRGKGSKALQRARIYRLREGVERWLVTDVNNPGGSATSQSKIAVMWDQAQGVDPNGKMKFHHVPGGANVLYMDGHVSWVKYPHKSLIPCTKLMGAAGVNW